MSFSINCIEIKDNEIVRQCKLYKVLKPGRYFFNDFYDKNKKTKAIVCNNRKIDLNDYWGEKISVCAVVGRNGSGKSSLMDLMYMAINNFTYLLKKRVEKNDPLCFVAHLYVMLYYSIDGIEYLLDCDDFNISLRNITNNVDVCSLSIKEKRSVPFIDCFFHTVISNFSIQSFIPENNIVECYRVDGNGNVSTYNDCWLNNLFHKNDGYTRPIVINPSRDGGKIDLVKEEQVETSRVLALLLYSKFAKQSFDGEYRLNNVVFKFNERKILSRTLTFLKLVSNVDLQIRKRKDNVYKLIIDEFHLRSIMKEKDVPPIKKLALFYLKNKIEKILVTNPLFERYNRRGSKSSVWNKFGSFDKFNYVNFLRDLKSIDSHVVTKIHQVVNFLNIDNNDDLFKEIKEKGSFSENQYFEAITRQVRRLCDKWRFRIPNNTKDDCFIRPFGFEILSKIGEPIKCGIKYTFKYIMENTPPPIFNYDIFLDEIDEKKKDRKINIPYISLSSGERQMLHTLSTHLYHIRNVGSIESNSLFKYKCMNLIFDEVEICFHPEYQRQFINKVMMMVKVLSKETNLNFNLFVITHSPFILSDFPKNNVTCMEMGKVLKKEMDSFGQNVCVLLNQHFFMDYFVGDFAKNKINSLIKYLLGKESGNGWSDELAEKYISLIGDDFLRQHIKQKFLEKNRG